MLENRAIPRPSARFHDGPRRDAPLGDLPFQQQGRLGEDVDPVGVLGRELDRAIELDD
jgi:hypothetical protein